jgi:hypothetical protein
MAFYIPWNHFNNTSNEVIEIILSHLLVYNKPIIMGFSIYKLLPEVRSILLTYKRFHRIAEYLIYYYNTFEI